MIARRVVLVVRELRALRSRAHAAELIQLPVQARVVRIERGVVRLLGITAADRVRLRTSGPLELLGKQRANSPRTCDENGDGSIETRTAAPAGSRSRLGSVCGG